MSILICRPEPFASELNLLLKLQGLSAIVWPALRIEKSCGDDFEVFCDHLQKDDSVVVTSQFVVNMALEKLNASVRELLKQVPLLAVGATTAAALRRRGFDHVQYPEPADSEHLLALPELQKVHGKTVWVLRGQSGRELLSQTLIRRGATVCPVTCYQRIYNTDVQALQTMLQKSSIDLIVLTSLDGLKAFCQSVPPNLRSAVKQIPVTVIGNRMLDLAKQWGFSTLLSLTSVSNHDLVALLQQHNTNYPHLVRKAED